MGLLFSGNLCVRTFATALLGLASNLLFLSSVSLDLSISGLLNGWSFLRDFWLSSFFIMVRQWK